jgi:hypothetical protein
MSMIGNFLLLSDHRLRELLADPPSSEESFGYYLCGFESLKSLIHRGAANRSGMLVWLS